MKTSHIATAVALALAPLVASSTVTTGLIIPLYWDPSSSTDCWSNVRAMGTFQPDLPLVVIINPDSGPTGGSDEYYSCLPTLRSDLPKAKIVGYVDTGDGDVDSSNVMDQVSTYYGWKSGTGDADVSIDGIFLDDTHPTSSLLSYYTTCVDSVRTTFGHDSFVVLNPGSEAPASYYSIADMIVSYESPIDTYSASQVADATSADCPADKQGVMVLSITSSDLPTLISDNVGVYGWFFATDLVYGAVDVYSSLPTIWTTEVADVVAAQNLAAGSTSTLVTSSAAAANTESYSSHTTTTTTTTRAATTAVPEASTTEATTTDLASPSASESAKTAQPFMDTSFTRSAISSAAALSPARHWGNGNRHRHHWPSADEA